jgi:hypothetical protein
MRARRPFVSPLRSSFAEANGSIIRSVATVPPDPRRLAVDPLSGDLFTTTGDTVERISNYESGLGTVTTYSRRSSSSRR